MLAPRAGVRRWRRTPIGWSRLRPHNDDDRIMRMRLEDSHATVDDIPSLWFIVVASMRLAWARRIRKFPNGRSRVFKAPFLCDTGLLITAAACGTLGLVVAWQDVILQTSLLIFLSPFHTHARCCLTLLRSAATHGDLKLSKCVRSFFRRRCASARRPLWQTRWCC